MEKLDLRFWLQILLLLTAFLIGYGTLVSDVKKNNENSIENKNNIKELNERFMENALDLRELSTKMDQVYILQKELNESIKELRNER